MKPLDSSKRREVFTQGQRDIPKDLNLLSRYRVAVCCSHFSCVIVWLCAVLISLVLSCGCVLFSFLLCYSMAVCSFHFSCVIVWLCAVLISLV